MTPTDTTQGAATLKKLIREQSAAEVGDVLAQGRERAQRIAAAAEAETESIRSAARREGEERGGRQAATLLATARAASYLQWLWDREALIDAAIQQARAHLAGFPARPGEATVLADLIREGLQALPPGPVRVRLPAEYAKHLDATTQAELSAGGRDLRIETDAHLTGGVLLETADGRLRFDNSFEARLRQRRHRLRCVVAEVLLGEEAAVDGR